jgi:RNA-directed DNA polymerase
MPYHLTKPLDLLREEFKKLNSPRAVAALLEVDYERLIYHLHKVPPSKRYTVFTIPKKSGAARKITAPISPLKILQKKLSFILSSVVDSKHSAHGFVRGRSIRTNSRVHADKKYVFTIDLENFFPSINFGRVRGLFMAPPFKFNAETATILAQICTFENSLPQGAPTSPVVSNILCRKIDQQLSRLARNYKCDYTRYADDITFSTAKETFPKSIAFTLPDSKEPHCGDELSRIISDSGFTINAKKVRLIERCRQQKVTGLVSNEFPNVDRRFIRQIRAMLHAAQKFGFTAAEKEFHAKYYNKLLKPGGKKPSFKKVLKGKIDFVGMVRGKLDRLYLKLIRKLQLLDETLVRAVPSETWISEIKAALFVIDVHKPAEKPGVPIIEQGTGFLLKGIGLVTCAHVINERIGKLEVYQGTDPSKLYDVDVSIEDLDADIAVLTIHGFTGPQLLQGDDGIVREDTEVILAGYPGYARGHSGTIGRGRVVGTNLHFDKKRMLIDAVIFPGNSGGPVLNNERRVIGIAAKGDGGQNSIVPISAIKEAMTRSR